MPWTTDSPPNVAKNWSSDEIARCVAAANQHLAENEGDEQGSIFACVGAAGRGKGRKFWDAVLEVFGGPGSGHHGHKGIPGQRGGSVPAGRTVGINAAYFEDGPGSHLIEGLPDDMQQSIIETLSHERIHPQHLDGLDRITTEAPRHSAWDGWTVEHEAKKIDSTGAYSPETKTIHINPDARSEAGNIIAHELGHHVTMSNESFKWRDELIELDFSAANAITRYNKGSIGKVTLYMTGMRDHSFIHKREFMADAFRVYQHGTTDNKDAFMKSFGVNLDKSFGVS